MGLHKIRKQLFLFFFLEMATINILMEPVTLKETKGKEKKGEISLDWGFTKFS